jgi:D-3-phosphoglycerate dehydrogenase
MSLARGEWDRKRFTGTEVFEKTIGIIGLGKIGREVAARCRGLGMSTIGYDPVLSAEAAGKLGIEPVGLEDLYRRADVITVHTPLSDETKGLLNDAAFARCKKGVRIVNCARGGIVDEAALKRALDSGRVAGAALDVFEKEPPAGSPLLSHPHVIVTPHLGASTEEAQEKVAIQIAHAVVDALNGRSFTGVVNSGVMALTLKEEVRPWLDLAERLGSLVAQLGSGKLRRLTVGAAGDAALSSLELLKAGVLKGILARVIHEPVNFVNAPALAAEMGITAAERREESADVFASLLTVSYEADGGARNVAGTVIGREVIRLVMLDGFRFEVRPEGNLLIYTNVDRPGVLARVGGILARHNVNIAGVSLGRSSAGGSALTVMNLDGGIPDQGLAELRAQEDVTDLKSVRLD